MILSIPGAHDPLVRALFFAEKYAALKAGNPTACQAQSRLAGLSLSRCLAVVAVDC
jgi:hypothetical protein